MSLEKHSNALTRRELLAGSAAAVSVSPFVFGLALDEVVAAAEPPAAQTGNDPSIRPFTVHVPKAKLDELRRRVLATQWPDKETVADQSQDVQLAKISGAATARGQRCRGGQLESKPQ